MKKHILRGLAVFLSLSLFGAGTGCAGQNDASLIPTDNPLHVEKVDGLSDDFILGIDASSVISEEDSGVKYYDFAGKEQDVFATMAQSGVTHIRVRVWNNPYDAEGHGYGGGNCDLEKAVQIGVRAARVGLKLIVDFHYSDFWADPGKQMVPLAWADMDIAQKSEALYAYTKESLETLTDAGALVDLVQLGNETNNALCGETSWENMLSLWRAGSKAVREACPDALVAVHFSNPEKEGSYATYAKHLDDGGLDYDVFASSYYPFWHGTLENLAAVLSHVVETYGKKVMVMETAYAYTARDTDFYSNTVPDEGLTQSYPYSVQGQADAVHDVVETVASLQNGIGVVYWEGAWISVGGSNEAENARLWEKYGSGWATRFSAVYDPDDAGKYYGGCNVDNQALFDETGHPLSSLQIFNLVRYGNDGKTS